MNRVVLIFVLFRLSSYLMFSLFDTDEAIKSVSLKAGFIENHQGTKEENVNNYTDLLSVER